MATAQTKKIVSSHSFKEKKIWYDSFAELLLDLANDYDWDNIPKVNKCSKCKNPIKQKILQERTLCYNCDVNCPKYFICQECGQKSLQKTIDCESTICMICESN